MTIRQRQYLLAYLGYYVGDFTDKWTQECKVACKAFQLDFNGIAVDGYGGPETDKALKHAVAYGISKKQDAPVSGDFWDDIKYFKKAEFRCKCGCGADEMNETLIRVADRVRGHFGSPVTVSSGRRCAKHNAKVGGVANSRHTANPGKAMDFCVRGKTSAQVLAYVQKQPEIRYAYAIDGTYVHMDVN